MDESIQLGSDKILVVLGIRESQIDFNRALILTDMTPFVIKSQKSWTADLIKQELENLKNEIGTIIYSVADHGRTIKKALTEMDIKHIHDLTHKIALILEKLLTDSVQYLEISEKMTETRMKTKQSDIAYLIAPKQRKKSRFLNIKIIAKWANQMLSLLNSDNTVCQKVLDTYGWLKQYESFLCDMKDVDRVICEIGKILKTCGLSQLSKSRCFEILDELSGELGTPVKEQIKKHLDDIQILIPDKDLLLITSDIIESSFGKYKNMISRNPMAGITNLALSIAAFTSDLSEETITTALETTTVKDIEKWSDKNIGNSLLKKRREAFSISKKNGTNGF